MAASMRRSLVFASRRSFKEFCLRDTPVHQRRFLQTSSTLLGAHDAEFAAAKERLNSLKEDPGNQAKLQIYALFKQATIGKCSTKRPGMVDFVGRAKWDAWNALGDMSEDDAQLKYIEFINELAGTEAEAAPAQADPSGYQTIKVDTNDNIFMITLNRPDKFNAINLEMYAEWQRALEASAQDESTTITAVTGAGKYFSSGNDLSNFQRITAENMAAMAQEGGRIMSEYVKAFIDHPKPLVGFVNGPAVGISCSTLGLYDLVYASDQATFNMPFTALGQSAEGCSSFLYPKIMGPTHAREVLMFNRKLTAQQAYERGLVTEVFQNPQEAWDKIREYAKLPKEAMRESKKLIRGHDRETLHKVNMVETEVLMQRWQSEECINAIMNFFNRKN